jgi:hypothetical protein
MGDRKRVIRLDPQMNRGRLDAGRGQNCLKDVAGDIWLMSEISREAASAVLFSATGPIEGQTIIRLGEQDRT